MQYSKTRKKANYMQLCSNISFNLIFYYFFLFFHASAKKRQKHISSAKKRQNTSAAQKALLVSVMQNVNSYHFRIFGPGPSVRARRFRLIGPGSSGQAHWSGYPDPLGPKRWARGRESPPHARWFRFYTKFAQKTS